MFGARANNNIFLLFCFGAHRQYLKWLYEMTYLHLSIKAWEPKSFSYQHLSPTATTENVFSSFPWHTFLFLLIAHHYTSITVLQKKRAYCLLQSPSCFTLQIFCQLLIRPLDFCLSFRINMTQKPHPFTHSHLFHRSTSSPSFVSFPSSCFVDETTLTSS